MDRNKKKIKKKEMDDVIVGIPIDEVVNKIQKQGFTT